MDLAALIATLRTTPDCTVFPPAGLPVVEPGHQLPDDLLAFYRICGGIDMPIRRLRTLAAPPRKLFHTSSPECERDKPGKYHQMSYYQPPYDSI